ncbi:hypothetical protein ABPG72_006836 [Tetrahymena utriculariae]
MKVAFDFSFNQYLCIQLQILKKAFFKIKQFQNQFMTSVKQQGRSICFNLLKENMEQIDLQDRCFYLLNQGTYVPNQNNNYYKLRDFNCECLYLLTKSENIFSIADFFMLKFVDNSAGQQIKNA